MFLLSAQNGQWPLCGLWVAALWQVSRERMRWLWNLPVRRSLILPAFLAPPVALMVAGYIASFHSRRPRVVPDARAAIVELTAMLLAMLLVQLVTVMADWRPLRRIPRKVRNVGLALVIGIPSVGGLAFVVIAKGLDPLHAPLMRFSSALPGSLYMVALAAVSLLTAVYALINKLFRESEYADKGVAKVWGSSVWPGTNA